MTPRKTKKYNLKVLILLFVLFLSICAVSAHQPRLEVGINSSTANPIVVSNPEISQAFYGNLIGQPDYYKITSDKSFNLYVNLLVPQSPGINPDFISAQITDSSGKTVGLLIGKNSTWMPLFEDFGGDYYLQGPAFNQTVPAGTYTVKIFNANNTGKYAVAIGSEETFPPLESLNALYLIPILKEQIFSKPVTTLFFEFLGIILALGAIMSLFAMLFMSRKSEEITQLTKKVAIALRPMMWTGIAITAIVWIYVLSKDLSNIIGLVNTAILIIAIILSWYVTSKIMKMEYGKLPIVRSIILVLFWWLFVYWAITVI